MAAVRDEKRSHLEALLRQLRAEVQSVADQQPDKGAAIIRSAGFTLHKGPGNRPKEFRARLDRPGGPVRMIAPAAARRASYDWRYSADGGETWTPMPSTMQSWKTLSGVPLMTTVHLQYRALTRSGWGEWSRIIALVVV
jgi:hypothetical protein